MSPTSQSSPLMASLAAAVTIATGSLLSAQPYVFSEFDGTGFHYVFGGSGFEQDSTLVPGEVRLYDPVDAAGGAGFSFGSEGIDLTPYADNRVQIDFTVGPANDARWFDFQLLDTSDRAANWQFNLRPLEVGTATTGVSLRTLSDSDNMTPGFDLSSVRLMQIVGDYASVPREGFEVFFDRILLDDLPPPPAYPGAEPDAPWRAEAVARIDAHRKADLQVNVSDAFGNTVLGAEVAVAMQRHEFGFGTAISTPQINRTDADGATYRQKITELFNLAVTENALKWQPWAGDWGPQWDQANTLAALDWMQTQNIPVRGHNILWAGEDVLPDFVLPMLQSVIDTGEKLPPAEQATLRGIISDHISDIVQQVGNRVTTWDVVNEPRVNHLLMDALDEDRAAMVDWFNEARAQNPNAKLFLNEYSIVNTAGDKDTADQQEYFDELTALVQGGAAIDGLGIQGHFRENDLTGPEDLWEIYDRFATLGLSMEITEFDFESTDRDLQAEYLRDFLTATFAHEGVDNFLQWGFWAGSHWRPEAALFDENWNLRPHGQAYIDLVYGDWWTDETLQTTADGSAALRAFKGEFLVTVSLGDQTVVVPATLSEGGLTVDVSLALRPGDFNSDGTVDAADYTVWRDNFGSTVDAFTSGDANGDSLVDADDWRIWRQNFGLTASIEASGSRIPEPSAMVLLCPVLAAVARKHGPIDRLKLGAKP